MARLRELLDAYRAGAKSPREMGTYFERFAKAWLEKAPTQEGQFLRVLTYAEWAAELGKDGRDVGIDLCAQLADQPDLWCAIQCKFYASGYRIQRSDIDSFFTASGTRQFARRIIIDTTDAPWGTNAEAALQDQAIVTTRIGLSDIEDSGIDWVTFATKGEVRLQPKKTPRKDQVEAIDAVIDGLKTADRGKLIMACGTGKTFTALKIVEKIAGAGGRVLYLVPSLALMSQTVREWSIDADIKLRSFAVCSDAQVGVRKPSNNDFADINVHDLEIPATTNAADVALHAKEKAKDKLTVVFSTYQSIQVISQAQKTYGLPKFDIIVCDEAHRTTGAKLVDEDESNFIKVHKQDYIASKKRLYMTATPRVFGDAVKSKASEASAELCSMDDEKLYGDTLFVRSFGWAVENQLLTDYKVLVLAVDEEMVSVGVQHRLQDGAELKLDDATKIIGCYKALTKRGLKGELLTDPEPMKRGLAFCKDIATSKLVQSEFSRVVSEYLASDEGKEVEGDATPLECQLSHVDGTFSAHAREVQLTWLKEEHGDHACRILTNARCLSEGVDVPALDAILFMHPRKSQIDVVQSVGRVMRRAPNKNMGYVILPIGVPAGKTPEEALNDNERYRVVWQILNALRSHDERFDASINKIDLGVDASDRIEVIAVTNKLPTRKNSKTTQANIGQGAAVDDDDREPSAPKPPTQGVLLFDEFSKAIMAKIVKKCGRRDYWEDWAGDIAKIAQSHISRITALVKKSGTAERKAFEVFLAEIRDDLNPEVDDAEAIEMLAQHLITRPVFDALFEGYSFAQHNPVSIAMQKVLDKLHEHNLEKEAESLQKFYDSVRKRASGIDSAAAKQKIVVELYEKFFSKAFPKLKDRLGIVYTPIEVVDFIIRSVNEALQSEFGQTLGSKGVHILDPFTGTGTFITRLLQSGLIKQKELEHKYRHEIHANEIVLLAYYIAAINIEATYHGVVGGDYVPFAGICLTDTFQLYEQQNDLVSDLLADNSTRRSRQKKLDIRVIVGNPPYSIGQGSENDNSKNLEYLHLDQRLRDTYVARSDSVLARGLYDSYIRAFRWASDRVGDAGIIAFVSNAGWLDATTADGMRRTLAEEFSSIYVFSLRGNARTSGERRRKEKDNVFGQGTRTPVAITLLVKNKNAKEQGRIFFHDIGDYLARDEKLASISRLGSIEGIAREDGWRTIVPNEQSDWINQRDKSFDVFVAMGDKRSDEVTIFEDFSQGVVTARDAWVFNSSRKSLKTNMKTMTSYYNAQVDAFQKAHPSLNPKKREEAVENFIDTDSTKISWSRALKADLGKGKRVTFHDKAIVTSLYRPFSKQHLYFDRRMNEVVYKMPSIFPSSGEGNRAIMVKGNWRGDGHFVQMIGTVACLQPDGGAQCFPRYLYIDEAEKDEDSGQGNLLNGDQPGAASGKQRDAITDEGLAHFRAAYPGEKISKDDLFYYIYGLLHSEDYRSSYADNLSKQLPRIPVVKSAADFWDFVEAGRKLGDLHCDYENAEPYAVTFVRGDVSLAPPADPEKFYRVEQMKFAGKRPNLDKTTVIYNANITIAGIPSEAYDYVVNGKPALEWVMERQCVKTDKASGIVNDANRYALETVGNPAYPLELFQRVITVSLETMKIVKGLPKLGELH